MMRSVWYLGLETVLLVFVPLYGLALYPELVQWRVPLMATGLVYVAVIAKLQSWGWRDLSMKGMHLSFDWLTKLTLLCVGSLFFAIFFLPPFLHIREFVYETYGLSPYWSIAAYVFLSAPLQEFLFRGFYIARLRLVTKNRYFVVIYTSLIFGLIHAVFANKWLGLLTTLMGVFWSWYVYKTRNLLPVIVSHAILGGIIMAMTLL